MSVKSPLLLPYCPFQLITPITTHLSHPFSLLFTVLCLPLILNRTHLLLLPPCVVSKDRCCSLAVSLSVFFVCVCAFQWWILGLLASFHVGLAKGFLQSLLAFCPPPICRNYKLFYFLEVGILPTELCWSLFVKPSWLVSHRLFAQSLARKEEQSFWSLLGYLCDDSNLTIYFSPRKQKIKEKITPTCFHRRCFAMVQFSAEN